MGQMAHRGRTSKAERATLAIVRDNPTNKPPPPIADLSSSPAHLSPAMQAWWRDVLRQRDYTSTELFALQMACEAYDEAEAARQLLAKKGRTYKDANGVIRKWPEVAIEQNARGFFLRAVRQLGLLRSEREKDPNRNCAVGISWRDLEKQREWE
jgi:P27 family predicted phage terminase small subunit